MVRKRDPMEMPMMGIGEMMTMLIGGKMSLRMLSGKGWKP